MTQELGEVLFLLANARDCVAESKDAAEAARVSYPARVKYFKDLLSSIDKVLKETGYD